jgi:hypothetical protein
MSTTNGGRPLSSPTPWRGEEGASEREASDVWSEAELSALLEQRDDGATRDGRSPACSCSMRTIDRARAAWRPMQLAQLGW